MTHQDDGTKAINGQKQIGEQYRPKYCPECGKKRCPPEMDLCPYCHPNTEYTNEDE